MTALFESFKLFLHVLLLCTLVSIHFAGYLYNIIVGQKGETGDQGPKGDPGKLESAVVFILYNYCDSIFIGLPGPAGGSYNLISTYIYTHIYIYIICDLA